MTVIARDRAEVRAVLHAVDEYRRACGRSGRPIPPPLTALHSRLEMAYRTNTVESPTRHGGGVEMTDLEHDWIGTGAAAELLGVEHRTVQRRAQQLGGRKVNGRWLFHRKEITRT